MVTKGCSISVMYLFHVSNNGHQGWPVSAIYLSYVSNNGHQGVSSFCYVSVMYLSHVSNNIYKILYEGHLEST